jgi:hypothetical protein
MLAAACVTITPAKVATAPSPDQTSSAPIAAPTSTPTPDPTAPPATPTSRPGTSGGKPVKTPKPNKTVEPTNEPTIDPRIDDPACFDDAFTLEGFSWDGPFEWRYNSPSTPAGYDADAVVAVLQRGFDNIVNENNDCGRSDNVYEDATYLGTTPSQACGRNPDGLNVVAWGKMPDDLSPDTIAYTCPFHIPETGKIVDADIVLNVDIDWALSQDDCTYQELLEPTITHEVGHALGLGHVSERAHGELTMSTRSNGACSNEESTLGLGDMLALEQLYPAGE